MLSKMLSRFQIILESDTCFFIGDDHYYVSKLVNMLPLFISKIERDNRFGVVIPPMILSTLPDSPFSSILNYIDSVSEKLFDSGELLEFAFAVSIFNITDLAKNQTLSRFLPWIHNSFHGKHIRDVKYVPSEDIKGSASEEIHEKIERGDIFILQPAPGSESGDLYCKINKVCSVFQIENTKRRLGWAQVSKEMRKMGEFSTFVHYVFASLNLSTGLVKMAEPRGFISLSAGHYYYSDSGELILLKQHGTAKSYYLVTNDDHVALKYSENDPRVSNSIELEGYFIYGHSALGKLKNLFNSKNSFTVPHESNCVVLAEPSMKLLLGEHTYEKLLTRLKSSKAREFSHTQFFNSLFRSSGHNTDHVNYVTITVRDEDERTLKMRKTSCESSLSGPDWRKLILIQHKGDYYELLTYAKTLEELKNDIEKKLGERVEKIWKKRGSKKVVVHDDDDTNNLKSEDELVIKREQQI
eukprot:gb/GECH01010039.1/.p1 GENE.gb/GECH01010039.1/~~gb/GECH01010039.1/.p1  ORF type:complete len:469 (+),score=21.33 gb/GECH01010039.1/:1-1407(+)